MSIGTRIRAARKASGLSQEALGKVFNPPITRSAVAQWENGESNPATEKLDTLSRVLNRSVQWFLADGEPVMPDGRMRTIIGAPLPDVDPESQVIPPPVGSMQVDVPVYGQAVGGSEGDFQFNGQVVDRVRRPPGLIGNRNAFCIYIAGSSMEPKFEQGELIYVDPNRPARSGDYVLIEMKATQSGEPGAAYVKRLIATTATKIRVQQFNPPNDRIEFARDKVLYVRTIMKLADLLGV